MNEEHNVNNTPKPKKKRSFWWLKLLLILVLFAAGIVAGIMLSSQSITQRVLDRVFPQYAMTEVQTFPVETLAPEAVEMPIEFKPAVTATPKPSKAPVEIISPEAKEKEEAAEKPEITEKPEASEKPEVKTEPELSSTPAPVESPNMNVLPAFAPQDIKPAQEEKPGKTELVGIDAALDAALKHAGVDKDEAIIYSVSREKDDGFVYYEVEFGHNGKEYEYEVNAYTGTIESWKTVRGVTPAASAGDEPKTEATDSSYVSLEDAKATALFHAGYREHETTDLKASLEIENNKVVYDIEFWAEGYDYDYKVDAVSGLVIMVEKERD